MYGDEKYMTLNENVMTTMTMIGKAIAKGAVEDIKSYLQTCDTITTNGMPGVRADKINTNLSKMVASENIEIKLFKRSSWKGVLVVDKGKSSLIGNDLGLPYTVALDEKTILLQLYLPIISNRFIVDTKLF